MTPRCQLLSHRLPVREVLRRPPSFALRKYTTSDSVPGVVKNPLRRRKGGDLGTHNVKDIIPEGANIPKYPHGDHQLFKRSNKGLYGEQKIEFGNNVSAKTETRTRRSWSPNTFNKGLYSVALKKKIMLRVTSKVLKIIDREGGLDEYLLKDSEKRIKELGPFGWKLRWVLMQKPEIQDRYRTKAEALGIDQELIDTQWPTHEVLSERGSPKAIKKAREQAPGVEHEGKTGLPGFADLSVQDISGPFPESVHEYRRASKAATRYVRRKFVEDVDSGLVLAFLRAKERTEISERNLSQYEHKMNTIDDAYLEEMKARMNIDYTSKKRLQRLAFLEQKHAKIEEAGGLEAWNIANKPDTPRPTSEEKKAQYAQVIADARAELSDPKTSDDRRAWLEKAFLKAELAIKARASQPELGGGSREYTNMLAALKGDKTGGKFRWADIVASTKILASKGSKTLSA